MQKNDIRAKPGAPRVVLIGVMAVPDDFHRLRLMLPRETKGGDHNPSLSKLIEAVPLSRGSRLPYKLDAEDKDIAAVATLTPPKRFEQHWLDVAKALRGKEVRVEVTVRRYLAEPNREGIANGTALDISLIDEVK